MFIAKLVMAVLAVFSGLGVVLSPQTVHSALFLTCNLLCVAVIYLLMSFHFLGAAQLMVYAGAIMVVFLFAVTVLAPDEESKGKWADSYRLSGLLVASIFGATLAAVVSTANLGLAPASSPAGGLREFAVELFGKYVFAF